MTDEESSAISDEELVETVRELFESGRRDGLGGGVHPSRVADKLEAAPHNIYHRIAELERAGDLARVRGVNPDSGEPRASYAPAEYVENPK